MMNLLPNMSRNMKLALIALGAIVLIITASYAGSYVIESSTVSVSSLYRSSYTMNGDMVKQSTFKGGDTVILHNYIQREPMRCWATYIPTLEGPVVVELASSRSRTFVDHTVRFEASTLHELPRDLPAGSYHWKTLVYPTCQGVDVTPYSTDTGVTITVLASPHTGQSPPASPAAPHRSRHHGG